MTQTIQIAMFSGPRNISTTIMRSFENRPDTVVFDEPFYACYLKESAALHPMRQETLAAQSADWETVIDELMAPRSDGANISFHKHIAFHFAGNAPLDWVRETRLFMLIRDPRAMVASYKKKYDDVAPITESYRVQRRLYDETIAHGSSCPVIDARDVLLDPRGMITRLCAELGIQFTDKMLSWPAGPRDSDGPWAPHWYDAVWASTGFKPHQEKEIALTADLEAAVEACADDYAYFHERRLR